MQLIITLLIILIMILTPFLMIFSTLNPLVVLLLSVLSLIVLRFFSECFNDESINFLVKLRLKKLNKKIYLLNEELKLIPNSQEGEILKKLKIEKINQFKKEKEILIQNFINKKFNQKIYVILKSPKNLTSEIKTLYKSIAIRDFNTRKIVFITPEKFKEIISIVKDLARKGNISELNPKIKVISNLDFVENSFPFEYFIFKKI